jgi:hypothetical protein
MLTSPAGGPHISRTLIATPLQEDMTTSRTYRYTIGLVVGTILCFWFGAWTCAYLSDIFGHQSCARDTCSDISAGSLPGPDDERADKHVGGSMTAATKVLTRIDDLGNLPLPLGSFDARLFSTINLVNGQSPPSRLRAECVTIVQVHDGINVSLFTGLSAADIIDLAVTQPSLVAVSVLAAIGLSFAHCLRLSHAPLQYTSDV